jgi:hypothetical protein
MPSAQEGVADEELDAIEIASTHTIEIDSFVPRSPPCCGGVERRQLAA